MFLRKYNTAATINGIPLIARNAADLQANPTLAAGDVKISKDGGAFVDLATLPTVAPAGDASVQISLSAAETQAARLVIKFVDQTSPKEREDQVVIVETFGHASAQLAYDLSSATVTVGANNDKSGYSLASTGLNLVLVDTVALPTALGYIAAAIAGKLSGAGTDTEVFVGLDGVTTRLTATVDSGGNRTAISYG